VTTDALDPVIHAPARLRIVVTLTNLSGRVEVFSGAGRLVASARPKADGSYRIALQPGRYRVTAVPTVGNPWFVPQTVVVRRGQFSLVELDAPVP
jgi:hypothetical protein